MKYHLLGWSVFLVNQWSVLIINQHLANGVSPSTFYYHIKTLRNKACDIPMVIQSGQSSHQDVVPISFIDENPVTKIKPTELAAVRISLHGMNIEILNHAEQSVIANTLLALQKLC